MLKTVTLILISILSLTFFASAMSDSNKWRTSEDESSEQARAQESRADSDDERAAVPVVTNSTYARECGACHFAYQPGLLRAAQWQRIMDSLDRHFGDDASLDVAQRAELLDYLLANAADRSSEALSRAFAVNSSGRAGALPRISEARFFRREHHEIPARAVEDNAEVRSFSNCQVCHEGANRGVFNEDDVNIPGFGRMHD